MREAEAMIKVHTAIESMMYNLRNWKASNIDNENVSDGLYGFVSDMEKDLTREYNDLEYEFGSAFIF